MCPIWACVETLELRGFKSYRTMFSQVDQKRKAVAMAALDKAEKKLSMAREELAKAETVLQFSTTQEALATRFRFSGDNIVTHESKDGEWLVRGDPCCLLLPVPC